MSAVQIQGNASGTGTLTLAAPNTNSNYTLTLPQATTTLVGTDATQTLTNKTIDGSQLVASSVAYAKFLTTDWTNSKTTSGYQKLPSGIIIQWGVTASVSDGGSATVTFPIAFPTALLNAMVTNQGSGGGNFGGTSAALTSTTTMNVGHYNASLNSSPLMWVAIGY